MLRNLEYKIGRYKITLNISLVIIFLLVQTLLNELGFWQIRRAQEKQRIEHQIKYQSGETLNSISLLNASEEPFPHFSGELYFLAGPLVFIDNQPLENMLGYHVYQLAEDEKGAQIWVARGWIGANKDRTQLPNVEPLTGSLLVSGRGYSPQQNALISSVESVENIRGNLRVLAFDRPLIESLNRTRNWRAIDKILRLDNDPGGLQIHWKWLNMPADKHLAYAIQWFSLALALLLVSLFAATKKIKE